MKELAPEREKEIRLAAADHNLGSQFVWQGMLTDLLAEIDRLRVAQQTLFDAIKHGDDEHQNWLRAAIEDHFAGRVPQPSTGRGITQAKLAKAIAALEELDAYGMPEHIAVGIRQTLKELRDE